MSHLSLALLGSPYIRHAGQAVRFRSRKELALLVYLALEGGLQSREKIIALLWPDSDEAQGRTTLRRTLADLRGRIEDADSTAHLIVQRDMLGFDFSSDFDLDLYSIEHAYSLAGGSSIAHGIRGEDFSSLLLQLQRAVSLFRGPFMEGFSLNEATNFENWIGFQREVWYQRVGVILDKLSQLLYDAGELLRAREIAARWITLDPLHEPAQRRLIEIHLGVGDYNAALRAYEAYRLKLAEELNVEPSAVTEALISGVFTTSQRKQNQVAATSFSIPFVSNSDAQTAIALDSPMIGRVKEYARLIEAFRASKYGQIQAFVVQGEAGIGKTRLADEFLAWAEVQGADVLRSRAFEAGGRLPYQPLVEALRNRIEQENAPDDLLSDPWLAELVACCLNYKTVIPT